MLLLLFAGIILSGSTDTYAATVAKIGSKSYSSLQSAIDAVKTNQTIKLQKNITQKKTINVKNGKKFTIDLKNHVITMKIYRHTYYSEILGQKVTAVDYGHFQIEKGNVTIKNGTINAKGKNISGVFSVGKKGKAALTKCKISGQLFNSGKLTINSGTYRFTSTDVIVNSGNLTIKNGTFIGEGTCMGIIKNNYKCTVSGGTFTNKYRYGGVIWTGKNVGVGKKASMSIKGGTFTGYDGTVVSVGADGTINLSKGKINGNIFVEKGGFFNMSGGSITNKNNSKTPLLILGSFTMKGGTITAINSAQNSPVALNVSGGVSKA